MNCLHLHRERKTNDDRGSPGLLTSSQTSIAQRKTCGVSTVVTTSKPRKSCVVTDTFFFLMQHGHLILAEICIYYCILGLGPYSINFVELITEKITQLKKKHFNKV